MISTLYEWVSGVMGAVDDPVINFLIYCTCGVLIVIFLTLALSLFVGIAFSIFKK